MQMQPALTIEALRQAVKILRHLLELAADGRALLRLPGALIAQLGNAVDLLIDAFRDVGLLL